MPVPAPNSNTKGPFKGGARRHENNKIYGNPLPLVFTQPEPSRANSVLNLLGLSAPSISNPHCEGYYDATTRSVWVSKEKDSLTLWRRGFFGKGDLSRSEPSWLARQINSRESKATGKMTSEEITARRREERRQFKLARAQAMIAAAAEAEAAFAEGREAPSIIGADGTRSIPSAATWKPQPKTSAATKDPLDVSLEEEDEEPLEDVEHLQLTLPEAFFLLWNLDCLTVLDPHTNEPMPLQHIWMTFQKAQLCIPLTPCPQESDRFDNPFLINYVAYHHYRSLGWVVKGGIKFCVDLLLYKRGPVFSHAEFAIVVCPVYEDPADEASSPFDFQNTKPFEWSWLSTINRVNSQVQKTLILAYVTIPARSRISPNSLSSPGCLAHYSVREVVIRRFIPARMRD
ncbi:hypothetical protein FIBSPDRAFT_819308 [Athelia psychrophila]|uniref:tRNA-splicing endonuclease subunit Sen2 n=1 Tax=Athelia psychrophila TaxID=1759441 RepID=A0A166Q052_9AGAM|nr:hypothetical protein FIBSPDRAFT_819308 [Fibularhizoctonia sp. CBS 109695]